MFSKEVWKRQRPAEKRQSRGSKQPDAESSFDASACNPAERARPTQPLDGVAYAESRHAAAVAPRKAAVTMTMTHSEKVNQHQSAAWPYRHD